MFWSVIGSFFGGGVGAVLGFWATRGQTKVERVAREREEWGRRFTSAMEGINSTNDASRATGRALLVQLMSSPLSTDEDRAEAMAVLNAAAVHDRANLQLLLPPGSNLDDVTLVRDTGDQDEPQGGSE